LAGLCASLDISEAQAVQQLDQWLRSGEMHDILRFTQALEEQQPGASNENNCKQLKWDADFYSNACVCCRVCATIRQPACDLPLPRHGRRTNSELHCSRSSV